MNSIKDWRKALKWNINRYSWDYYGTGTFRVTRKVTEARTLVEQYFEDLESRLRKPLPRFWVLEPHTYREAVHLHFLIAEAKNINEDVEELMWRYWRKDTKEGRFQSAEYDASKGGSGYMMKYLTKDMADWEIKNLDKLSTLHEDKSLLNQEQLEEAMQNELGNT